MVRIQLHLSEAQDRRLRAAARARGETRAELIRRAIDAYLAQGSSPGDALLALVAMAGPGGRPDAAEQHDDLLYRSEPPAPRAVAEPVTPFGKAP